MRAKLVKESLNQINEFWGTPLESIVKSLITSKHYDRRDVDYYRDQLAYSLRDIGITEKITARQLANHPNFEQLEDDYKSLVYDKVGTGKNTPNKKFMKEFISAFKTFPNDLNKEDEIYIAIQIKEFLDAGEITNTYDGIDYTKKRELINIISSYKLKDVLNPEEQEFIKKLTTNKYESFVKRVLSDENISKFIGSKLSDYSQLNSDERTFAKMNLARNVPEFYEFLKGHIFKGSSIDWGSLKVKTSNIQSKNSDVVSSSFTTSYYYDLEIDMMGEHFKFNNVLWSSNYTSGGWN